MRKGLKRFEGALRRVATVGVTAALALGMAVTGPVSAIAAEVAGGTVKTDDRVTLTKTATWDDEVADQANVELFIGSTEETTVSDVVFVLDKSASTDIRQEALNMLNELMKRAEAGNLVRVGVINFEQGVLDSLQLTELNQNNFETIKEHVIYREVDSSGTNIHAGLVAGERMLAGDSSVLDTNKHLVLVTDGVGYLWGADGVPYSIYSEDTSNGEENLYASHETIDWHHDASTYYDEFLDMRAWLNKYGEGIRSGIDTYGIEYDRDQYKAVENGVEQHQGTKTDWSVIEKFKGQNSYVPEELRPTTACAPDAALYMVATEWEQIAGKYHAYSYADPRYAKDGKYLWAYKAFSNLSSLGGYSTVIPASADDYSGMFDAVKSSVLYEIESGTVTDVIGNDFDFAGLDTIKMSVGSTELKGTVDEAAGTVTFGDKGEYVVSYTKAEDGTETLTWKIGAPVESANGVKLSYALNLANKSTVPGTYPVDTNEGAWLKYVSTGGSEGTGTFPVPELTYTVDALDPAITGGFVAKKELVDSDGNELDLKDGQFKFQVKDAEGSVIDEATNDAEGNIRFKKDMTFDDAGDYTYTISEVNDGQEGITYDTDDVTVTVHVADTDGDGDLDARWSYADDDMTFTNVSAAKATVPSTNTNGNGSQPSTSNNGNLPKTSDPTSLVGAGVALVGGLGAGAAGLVLRRRNK